MNRIAALFLVLCLVAGIEAYAQPPAPGYTGTTSLCTGSGTTLTATGQSGATFRWYTLPSGGSLVSSVASYTVPVQNTAGTYHWYVEQTVGGLTSPRTDVAVTVNATPTISVSPATTTVCSGSNTTLTASGANSYSWSPGNLSGASVSVGPLVNTTYTVVGTSNGCSASSSATVSVNKTEASADVTICYGGSTTLTASGAGSYVWNPGNLSGSSVSVSPTSTTTYIVSGTGSGCTTTDTVVVTVQPSLGLTAGANTTVTEGSIVNLTCSSVLPATYVWAASVGDINNLSGSSVNVVPTETNTYTVTATHANGCKATTATTVTVNKLVSVSGNTVLCPGASTILTAAGTGPFTWYDAASGGNLLYTGPTYNTPVQNTSRSYWVSGNGGPRKEIKLQVIPTTISATYIIPAEICMGDTAHLQTNFPGLVRWYDAPTGGTQIGSSTLLAPLAVTPSVTTAYYAEAVPAQISLSFSYTGAVQTWTVPDGVTSIVVDAYGSAGERLSNSKAYNSKGGRVQAVMNVTPGQVLYIYVGGKENFNGGGSRVINAGQWIGARGGDATDIRIGGTGLQDRALVAGGGGGTGIKVATMNMSSDQGHGGGLTGQTGGYENLGSLATQAGGGGAQSAGGNGGILNGVTTGNNYGLKGGFGYGGRSGAYSSQYSGGGGGGGWYGGGGGTASGDGGGGSSYTNPLICHNVVHTQGAWDDVGIVYITYGASCTGNAARVPATVLVKPRLTPFVSDTMANACAGSPLTLVASGLAPYREVAAFDGTQSSGSSYVSAAANNFTLEFWVKPANTITLYTPSTSGADGLNGQRYAIFPHQSGNDAGAGVSVGTNGINVFEHGNGYLPALLSYSGSIPSASFTHVAVVYAAKQPSLYINGSKVATGLTSPRPSVYPSIGSDATGGYGPFIGQLDHVRIWNGALTAAEVLAVMGKADTTISGKTLMARYTFDGGSRADDKGGQALWSPLSSNPQQTHYLYTWSGSGTAPVASNNEIQYTTMGNGTNKYWLEVTQNGCVARTDTVTAVADTIPAASISGNTSVCVDGVMPVITFTGSGNAILPYTFTYNVNGGAEQTITTISRKTRYVRIQQNGNTAGDWLHLAEIRAIETGTGNNVALGKNGTASGTSGGFVISNLTDGNLSNYWHSNGVGNTQYVELDLGSAYQLDRVELFNRQDCCWERAQNLQFVLKDSTGAVFSSRQINAWQNQNTNYKTSWAAAGSLTATVPVPTHVPGNYQYNLVSIKSALSCTHPQSGSATVSVVAKPHAALSTNPGTAVCTGTAVTFTATAGNATTPAYQWSRNGSVSGTGAAYTTNALANGDSIAVKVTTAGACAATTATAYVKMEVNSLPTATIDGQPCTQAPLAVLSSQLPVQVQWNLNGSTVATRPLGWDANATTVAGGSAGSGLAQLNGPNRSFVDASGNVYVADWNNHRVVKWVSGASAGVVVAGGNGAGGAANQLNQPGGVYVDAAQNVYVADLANFRVQKWAPGASSGVTVAGVTGMAGSTAQLLREPIAVTMDASGNLYVTDCYNHRIQKWAPGADTGVTVAGSAAGISGSSTASLNFPYSARLDASGNIYVADNANHRVVKWAPGASSGTVVAGVTGVGGSAPNELNVPSDIAIDGKGTLYIADLANNRVQRWTAGAADGQMIAGTGSAGNAAGQLNGPTGIMLDAAGNLYVTESNNNRVQKFAPLKDTSYVPTTSGSYTAVVTSLAGCSTTSAAKSVSQPPLITTHPVAVLAVCTGNPIVLGTAASNATSYIWQRNGVNIPAAPATAGYVKANAALADSGVYRVVASNGLGCYDTSAVSQVTVTPMSNTLPTGTATASNQHADGLAISYADTACRPITDVTDPSGGNVLGLVQAGVAVDDSVQVHQATPYLQRHYDIRPTTDGAAVVKLYATQAEFDAYNNYVSTHNLGKPLMPTGPSDATGIGHLNVVQYHGLPSADTTGPGGQYDETRREVIFNSAITTTWNGSYWTLAFPVSGFSGFFITTGTMTPLAISLNGISARNKGAHNQVDWSTASESTGDYMELERSFNGKDFARIAMLAGTSTTGAMYTHTDEQPVKGLNYYRVKMLGADGRYSYSKTVMARVQEGGGLAIAVFPNPVQDQLTLQASVPVNGMAVVTLTDAAGKVVRRVEMRGMETKVSVADLAAGYYLLRYRDDVYEQNIKVVKSR